MTGLPIAIHLAIVVQPGCEGSGAVEVERILRALIRTGGQAGINIFHGGK